MGLALGLALGPRQGRPRVQRLKGRWVALSPPVSRRPGSYPSPRPRRRPPPRRRPRPRRRRPQRGGKESPEPPPTPQTPRGVPTGSQHPLYKKIPRSGRKIFGRWVFNFGRWVFTDLGVGCLPRILGVGWHGPPVGRWVLGVGCLWRRRWVVLEDPERRQRGGSTSNVACLDLGASRVV